MANNTYRVKTGKHSSRPKTMKEISRDSKKHAVKNKK